jgi:hypothetical protein
VRGVSFIIAPVLRLREFLKLEDDFDEAILSLLS